MKIKIVEKGGTKLTDLLHKSTGWISRDCLKDYCLICTSVEDETDKVKCYMKNIMYETFCITRQEKIEKEAKEVTGKSQVSIKRKSYLTLKNQNWPI